MPKTISSEFVPLSDIAKLHGLTRQALHQKARVFRVRLHRLGRSVLVRRQDVAILTTKHAPYARRKIDKARPSH